MINDDMKTMTVGQDKYFVWDYNEKSDILNIHRRGKKVEGSAELSDFSFDFDKNGNIVGIELVYASEFLNHVGVQKEHLAGLRSAEITISKRADYAIAWIKLTVPGKNGNTIVEKKLPIPVPVVA